MGKTVLEKLESDGQDDRTDHHTNAEDYVLRKMDCSVSDIRLGEWLDVRRRLADGNVVGPNDAAQSDNEAK